MSVRRFNSSELIPLQLAFRLISKYRNQTFKQNSVIDKKGWYGKASSNKMFKKTLNNITISGHFFVSNDYFDKTGLIPLDLLSLRRPYNDRDGYDFR